ncbi:MAG: hypothetical protein ACREF3_00605, partial [Acetobacteraceae bacterium]
MGAAARPFLGSRRVMKGSGADGSHADPITWLARAAVLIAAAVSLAAAGPPPTPAIDHVEKLFGMTYNDPYFWMESGGPAFDNWMAAQGDYSRRVLDSIPGRAALLAQLRSLDAGETYVGTVVRREGEWIYSKLRPTDSNARIFIRPINGGTEHVLIDPSHFDSHGLSAHVDYWRVSPDARHIAYGISLGGRETGTLRIRNIDTGVDLPEQIDRTRRAVPSWVDNASFLYTRLPEPASGEAQRLTGGQVYLHRLGSDPATDVMVFGPGKVAGLDIG